MRPVPTPPDLARTGATTAFRLTTCLTLACLISGAGSASAQVRVSPASIDIDRPERTQQIVVLRTVEGRERDVTRQARLAIEDPQIARVDPEGLVFPLAEGATRLHVTDDSGEVFIPVSVSGLTGPPSVSFEYEIQPILTKGRCNSGGATAKPKDRTGSS